MRTLGSLFFCAAFSCVTMAAGTACSQTTPQTSGMEHHHNHAESTEKLGRVSFPTSCAAGSQAGMERGVALLHSFGYTEAQRQFEIAKADPGCAMPHWGVAMTQYQELWSGPDAAQLKAGAEQMAKARAAAAAGKITPGEKGLYRCAEGVLRSQGCRVSAESGCVRGEDECAACRVSWGCGGGGVRCAGADCIDSAGRHIADA